MLLLILMTVTGSLLYECECFKKATERGKKLDNFIGQIVTPGRLMGANSHHVEKEKALRAYQRCARTIDENYLPQ